MGTQNIVVAPGSSIVILVRAHKNVGGTDQYSDYAAFKYSVPFTDDNGNNLSTTNSSTDVKLIGGAVYATSSYSTLTLPNGVKGFGVYDFRSSSAPSGSGVVLNQYGLAGYASGVNQFYIDARDGSAYFRGKIDSNSTIGDTGNTLANLLTEAYAGSEAYTLASTAIQAGGGAIVNPSTKQLVQVNASNTTLYSGGNPNSGARVVMNQYGILGFDNDSNKVFLLTNQDVPISLPTGTQTLTAGGLYLKGAVMSGGQIVGASLTTTGTTGNVIITSGGTGSTDQITFNYGGSTTAYIEAYPSGLVISAGGSAQLVLTSSGNSTLSSIDNELVLSTAPYLLNGSGGNSAGGLGSLRNIWASSGSPSGGSPGDLWLVWS